MDQVDCCKKADIPAIAVIHQKTFGNAAVEPSEGLKTYYETIIFNNPWVEEDLPSLVYRSKEGKVEGFLGVVTRRMNYKGKTIRVAIPHRLMVAPDCSSPMAAMKIIKRFLSGPQDLVLGDGANDLGRKFMEGMGATTSYLYSMDWLCLLRPFSYMRNIVGKYKGLRFLAKVSWPVCSLLDSVASKVPNSPTRSKQLGDCTAVEMDARSLLSCIAEFSKQSPLHPEYNESDIKWLWDFLKNNTHRGRLQGFEVRNDMGKRIGAYLYYLKSKKLIEVMLLLARKDAVEVVFGHLLNHALNFGALCLRGRMEPKFLPCFWHNNCLVKRGSWAVVHARNPEILNVINRGDAMLSALEGELWLHSPSDVL